MASGINHRRFSKRDDYTELLIENEKRKDITKRKKIANPQKVTIGDLLKKDGKKEKIEKVIAKKKSEIKIEPIKMGDIEISKNPSIEISKDDKDNFNDEEEDFS